MVTIKKKGAEKTFFSTDYLAINGIEWVDDAGNVSTGLPTSIVYDEGNLIELPENFLDLNQNEREVALREGVAEDLKKTYGLTADDFAFRAFNLEKVGKSYDDEDDDEEDDDEPENIIDALIDMVSGFDSMTIDDKEYVIIPKEQVVKAICGITD